MPNMGDDIQMMKAGILEVADIYVINKSDIDGAALTEAYLQDNIEKREHWTPPVIRTVGYNRATVAPLVEKIKEHLGMEHCAYREKIRGLLRTMFLDYVEEVSIDFMRRNEDIFEELATEVERCGMDYYSATEKLYERFKREVLENEH